MAFKRPTGAKGRQRKVKHGMLKTELSKMVGGGPRKPRSMKPKIVPKPYKRTGIKPKPKARHPGRAYPKPKAKLTPQRRGKRTSATFGRRP